jgi:hypothetical protein
VLALDGAGLSVLGNDFVGTEVGVVAGQCLKAQTDTITVGRNRFNGLGRFTVNPAALGGLQTVTYPDIADEVRISAGGSVQSLLSASQAGALDGIAFVRITAGGSGYTTATLAIGGSGSGAAARAVIWRGSIIGAVMTAAGSGYGSLGTSVPVTITGDGSGAAATAVAGLVVPDGRRLRVLCDAGLTFARTGSLPFQDNAVGTDLVAPANALVEAENVGGTWRLAAASTGGGAGAAPALAVTSTYTASGAIAPTDNVALVNAADAVSMTLGAGGADGHPIVVKRFGAGAVTLTATIDGVAGAQVLMNSATLKESVSLAWSQALNSWLLI